MEIDYYNAKRPSVVDLINQLQKIVEDNPEISFDKVGVGLNSGEYAFSQVQLDQFEYKGKKRFYVDID